MAVTTFNNSTQEPGLEVYFTNAMIREIQRSNFAQVTDKSSSQVTIEGGIIDLKFERGGTVTQEKLKTLPFGSVLNTDYRILMDTRIIARRNSDQKILWEGIIKGEKSYFAPNVAMSGVNSVNPLYNHSARHQHISQLALDMMSEALDRMTENF